MTVTIFNPTVQTANQNVADILVKWGRLVHILFVRVVHRATAVTGFGKQLYNKSGLFGRHVGEKGMKQGVQHQIDFLKKRSIVCRRGHVHLTLLHK